MLGFGLGLFQTTILSQPPKPIRRWDFRGSLPADVTLTRASAGTYYNSVGDIVSAANDVPRFEYDPDTLVPRYLLLENESRTNLIFPSEDFTGYSVTGGSVVANQARAPDGTNTMDLIKEDTSTGNHVIVSSATVANNQLLSLSYYVQPAGRTFVRISMDQDGAFVNRVHVEFTLTGAGAVSGATNSGTGANAYGEIKRLPNGVYRCTLVGKPSTVAGTFVRGLLYMEQVLGATGYTGDGASGVNLWGEQLEVGNYSSSYMATVGATVTRASDVCTQTLNGLNHATRGTLFVKAIRDYFTPNNIFPYIVGLVSAAPNNDVIGVYNRTNVASPIASTTIVNGGSIQFDNQPPGNYAVSVPMKVCFSWTDSRTISALAGSLSAVATGVYTAPAVITVSFGGPIRFQPGGRVHLEMVDLYNVNLNDITVQDLTR